MSNELIFLNKIEAPFPLQSSSNYETKMTTPDIKYSKPAYRSIKSHLLYSQKIEDEDEFNRCYKGHETARCRSDSMKLWLKLRGAGAIRVNGTRDYDRIMGDGKGSHYWVEIKNVVYDEHAGVRQIMDKEAYYTSGSIEVIETSKYGLMNDELMKMGLEKYDRRVAYECIQEIDEKGGEDGWGQIVQWMVDSECD
jgi:hypothetical protein